MKFEKNKKGNFRNPYNVIQKLIDEIIRRNKQTRKEKIAIIKVQ